MTALSHVQRGANRVLSEMLIRGYFLGSVIDNVVLLYLRYNLCPYSGRFTLLWTIFV